MCTYVQYTCIILCSLTTTEMNGREHGNILFRYKDLKIRYGNQTILLYNSITRMPEST